MQCIKLTSCQIINCKDAYIRKLLRDEEAVCESSEYRSVRQLELIGQMFDRADADHSGGIDSSEFLSLITALEQNHLLRSNEDPNELFSRMDSDGSGEVDFQELSDWLMMAVSHGDAHDQQVAVSPVVHRTREVKCKNATRIPFRQGWIARDDQSFFGGWTLYWAELNGHDPLIHFYNPQQFSEAEALKGKWPLSRPTNQFGHESEAPAALEPLRLHWKEVELRGGGEDGSLELVYISPRPCTVRLHFRSISSQQDWWVSLMQTRDMTRQMRLDVVRPLSSARRFDISSLICGPYHDKEEDVQAETINQFGSSKDIASEGPKLVRTISGLDIMYDTASGETHMQPHYWTMAKMAFEKVLQQIIRPPRAKYRISELGPRTFEFNGVTFIRKDFKIPNKRGLFLCCSQWLKYDTSRMISNGPCLIYLHGNASCRLESMKVLSLCMTLGISLVTLDMSGSGMSQGSYVSLGHFEKDDVSAVCNYLRDNGFATALGIWGRSMGATTALLYASQVDPNIAAIVSDSAFSSLYQLSQDLVGMATQGMGSVKRFVTDQAIGMVSSATKHRVGFDVSDVDVLSSIHSCQRPILFIWGESDTMVLPAHAQRLREAHHGPSQECAVPGNHNSTRTTECYEIVAAFLHTHLVNRARDKELAAARCIAKYALRRKNRRKAEINAAWLANLGVGDNVKVRFRGKDESESYLGNITRARLDGTYDIQFNDGTIAIGVDNNLITKSVEELENTNCDQGSPAMMKKRVSAASLVAADAFLSRAHWTPHPSDERSALAQFLEKLSAIASIQFSLDVVACRYSWQSDTQQSAYEKVKREVLLNPLMAPPWFIEEFVENIYPAIKSKANPIACAKNLLELIVSNMDVKASYLNAHAHARVKESNIIQDVSMLVRKE